MTDSGSYSIPWKEIQTVTFICDTSGGEYIPPSGTDALINTQKGEQLLLYNFQVVQNGCRPDLKMLRCYFWESEERVLPVSIFPGSHTRIEYEVPLDYLVSISSEGKFSESDWHINVQYFSPDSGEKYIEGKIYSWVNDASVRFKGENQFGIWYLNPSDITTATFKKRGANESVKVKSQKIGECVTWENEVFPLIKTEDFLLQIKLGEDIQSVTWDSMQKISYLDNPWENDVWWQDAEIILKNGQILKGSVSSHSGYVTTILPDGMLINYQINALKEVSVSQ